MLTVDLGKDDAVALSAGGYALAHIAGDLDGGAAYIELALVLNPNLAGTWLNSGWVRIWLGEPDLAIEHLARAMRLSPLARMNLTLPSHCMARNRVKVIKLWLPLQSGL
jgi:tetratricopeptide (TPR) repeat protein